MAVMEVLETVLRVEEDVAAASCLVSRNWPGVSQNLAQASRNLAEAVPDLSV